MVINITYLIIGFGVGMALEAFFNHRSFQGMKKVAEDAIRLAENLRRRNDNY